MHHIAARGSSLSCSTSRFRRRSRTPQRFRSRSLSGASGPAAREATLWLWSPAAQRRSRPSCCGTRAGGRARRWMALEVRDADGRPAGRLGIGAAQPPAPPPGLERGRGLAGSSATASPRAGRTDGQASGSCHAIEAKGLVPECEPFGPPSVNECGDEKPQPRRSDRPDAGRRPDAGGLGQPGGSLREGLLDGRRLPGFPRERQRPDQRAGLGQALRQGPRRQDGLLGRDARGDGDPRAEGRRRDQDRDGDAPAAAPLRVPGSRHPERQSGLRALGSHGGGDAPRDLQRPCRGQRASQPTCPSTPSTDRSSCATWPAPSRRRP